LDTIAILLTAYAIDVVGGDLPNRLHPVAWMGNWISWGRRLAPKRGNASQFLFGCGWVVFSVVLIGGITLAIQAASTLLPWIIRIGLQAFLLKCMFSTRSLSKAAGCVSTALCSNDLPEARRQLSYHLVSRNTENLTDSQVAAATIESVAENTSDSIVAPLFFFAIGGLPGAAIYRFANTCDAMWGYRNDEFEWLGKAAARLDDLLNLAPARITAMLILLSGVVMGMPWSQGVRIWWRDRYRTSSPNAGHPMSAASGVLGVALEKLDCYTLGKELASPDVNSIRRAVRVMWIVSALWVLLLCTSCGIVAWSNA
jgi:adenosylcobinamide-phosphate synthase